MNSTSHSEPNRNLAAGEVLRVEGVSLAYRLRKFPSASLRERFVRTVRAPLDQWLAGAETHEVLRNVSFTLRRGERVALLGANGTGKTSLCRCITGLLSPSLGRVALRDEVRAVFNSQVSVLPELTGRENARLLARLLYPREPAARLREIVDEALVFSGVGEFADVPFENYSQGMKSRVCLAVLSARPGGLLILDEVNENTDLFFQKKMRERLLATIATSSAVLMVSHSEEQLRAICTRGVVLHSRQIAYDGDLERAFKAYRFLNAGEGAFPA